jgi:hypothetical protein
MAVCPVKKNLSLEYNPDALGVVRSPSGRVQVAGRDTVGCIMKPLRRSCGAAAQIQYSGARRDVFCGRGLNAAACSPLAVVPEGPLYLP